MKFFFDENFPKTATAVLEKLGHECLDPRGTSLEGCEDSVLWEAARQAGAILLTTDRDFFHSFRERIPEHPGIVVIALRKPNRAAIVSRLEWLLNELQEEDFRGRTFQLRDSTWLARPPLPER